jgi:hypothetical protein
LGDRRLAEVLAAGYFVAFAACVLVDAGLGAPAVAALVAAAAVVV